MYTGAIIILNFAILKEFTVRSIGNYASVLEKIRVKQSIQYSF